MRHHLDVLTKNHVLSRPEGTAYGPMYFVSATMEQYMEGFERIKASVTPESGKILAKGNIKAEG